MVTEPIRVVLWLSPTENGTSSWASQSRQGAGPGSVVHLDIAPTYFPGGCRQMRHLCQGRRCSPDKYSTEMEVAPGKGTDPTVKI